MSELFGSKKYMETPEGRAAYYSLAALEDAGLGTVSSMPRTLKIILEAIMRKCDGAVITEEDVAALAGWDPANHPEGEIAYSPSRVLLQDFTGVPAVVDLAAMREACKSLGGDPKRVNPLIPADLVIDHSIQVDCFGSTDSLEKNIEIEYKRNMERYEFLKWGQSAFDNFRVVPPATGIIHQVNLERIAEVVALRQVGGEKVLMPDTLVGTDSHTTMINGLGVLGWGVGGIEAEAAMLGRPLYMLVPRVVGVKLTGELDPGATATDLVLLVTQILREHGVVGKLVEFYGPGVAKLSLPDRSVIANMAPEYGATAGYFPVDGETLEYLRLTGRSKELVARVERYCKEQLLFGSDDEPRFNETLEIDMRSVEPSIAGPKRPQDRIALSSAASTFARDLESVYSKNDADTGVEIRIDGRTTATIGHGAVAIASITSCTNTSSPALMLGAGLLAKKAVEHGLTVKPWVKTSLAPGSRVVTKYLEQAGLLPYLEALKFHVVGYGCTTCIGNSGPIIPAVAEAVKDSDLVVAGVLSGNRNFEGRINPLVKANYLASPLLVVAYALAGSMEVKLDSEPIGTDPNGSDIYLADIWPTNEEINELSALALNPELFNDEYSKALKGDAAWNAVETTTSDLYQWDESSTYIRNPPFFDGLAIRADELEPIKGARVLALLGDSVTTDHISPAGAIAAGGPAARYLEDNGVAVSDFNSFGSRRGNHEVMMRGTFANVRIRNQLAPGTEGGVTINLLDGSEMSIYDAAMSYAKAGVPLVVLAGKDYGMGSSRDWAAKGTKLLGVRAVIAESYERIHRSNLVGMGVLPLQFIEGESARTLGLTGRESFDIAELGEEFKPGDKIEVSATDEGGAVKTFAAVARLDTPVDIDYYRNGGILQTVIRELVK